MNIKKFSFILFIMFFMSMHTYAEECSYKDQVELATEASKIKIQKSVESKPKLDVFCEDGVGEECGEKEEYFVVNILNLSKNLYLEVSNNVNNNKEQIYYSDLYDGIASFKWDDITKVTKFTFKVYATEDSSCPEKYLTTHYYTLPRKNKYADYNICVGLEDYYMCDEFVEYDPLKWDDFERIVEDYKLDNKIGNNKESFISKLVNFLLKYIIVIVITIVGISIGIYILIKRKGSDR